MRGALGEDWKDESRVSRTENPPQQEEATVSRLLADLEIDDACQDFLARRIVELGGSPPPQPIVQYLDAPTDPEDEDWSDYTVCVVLREEDEMERDRR